MMQSHRKWYKRTLALLLAVAMVATPATAFAQTEPAAEEPAASVVYAPEDLAAFSEALDSAGYDLPDNKMCIRDRYNAGDDYVALFIKRNNSPLIFGIVGCQINSSFLSLIHIEMCIRDRP